MRENNPAIQIKNLQLSYGDNLVIRDLNLTINQGEIFVVMGPSGCGKSTLLKSMIGLKEPDRGQIFFADKSFWELDETAQQKITRKIGVLYQGGALWSSFTLGENVALPLQLYSDLNPEQIREVVELKLSLVGMGGYADFYPEHLSGGMRKRAALARAIALDPEIIFLDEPSAGLDPVNSSVLDDLILQLRDTMGATIVIVSHELSSIFAIGDQAAYLDCGTKSLLAVGNPKQLLADSRDPRVIGFLTRGKRNGPGQNSRT